MRESVVALLQRHRRWLARASVVALLVAVGLQLERARPRSHHVELRLGDRHRQVVELRLAYLRDGDEYHSVRLHFPSGAPARIPLTTDLPSGRFQVNLVILTADGQSWSAIRYLDSPAALGKTMIQL